MNIVSVEQTGAELDSVHDLFLEYAASLSFNVCFGGFDQELAALPGGYVSPRGCLLLARKADAVAGCVAVARVDPDSCEMKRLYVRPPFRRAGVGRGLAAAAIARARALGYRRLRLETLPTMLEARSLYRSLGFTPCAPYYGASCSGTECYELRLTPVPATP
jgi:putative acetyltransferase